MNDLKRQQREAIERLRRDDVEEAFEEAKRKGKQAFLREYGFGDSQKWQVTYGDEAFPTKPIVARAIASAFGGVVPPAKTFFGGFGEIESRAALERLGYRCEATGPRDDQVDWSAISPDYRWLARNAPFGTSHRAVLYKYKPVIKDSKWWSSDGSKGWRDVKESDCYVMGEKDWNESLIERPSSLSKESMRLLGVIENDPPASAIRTLLSFCDDARNGYRAEPKFSADGKGKKSVALFLREENAWHPFSFIINRSNLLFYIRKPSYHNYSKDDLAEIFVHCPLNDNGHQELTIKIDTSDQAELLIEHVLEEFSRRIGFTEGSLMSREAIEAAMDAYDSYRQSGEHAAIFDAFGEPRDYWVRSTRDRPNRIYPSKPVVGFLRGKTELNGGWGQKSDAAAQLHNAGYIIVDAEGAPVASPERYEHLIAGADRIRLCARNYYIELARENGEAEVAIRAGDLGHDLGLHDRHPAICSALGSKEFQKLAEVPPPTHTLPNPSSSTVFTYKLASAEGHEPMTFEPMTATPTATNLILYGPPGTGKTYATAWEAVRLCLGGNAAEPLRHDRDALMTKYRRLAGEGRIEFVTFHQSFSYEDFVEGLRPTTGSEQESDDEGAGTSGGFSLKPHAGVFKIISERARLDTGDAPAKRLDRSRPIYKIALGQRGSQESRIRDGLDGGLIHLGWGGDIDWSDERFDDFEEIRKAWNDQKDLNASGKDPNIEMLFAFRSGLQVGDYVVISDGRDSYRAFGRVSGEYYFDADADFHPHRRSVEWIWRDDSGAERAPFYARNFRRQSAYRLDPNKIDWDALESVVIDPNAERPVASARPHVLIIDEINRANISKVFGELITLLETDKRLGCENEVRVRLPYSGTSFGVPANLHIIGTMNTADRSIALLDTALRRRFTFRELMPDVEELRRALAARQLDAANLDGIDLCKLLRTLNERIEYLFDREHQIGHAYFTGCTTEADLEEVMRHKVIPLLAEYFYEDWSKVAAVLGDGDGSNGSRFLESRRLAAPAGVADDDLGGDKRRWSVKTSFDFSDFAA